ncbi:MAG TPA: GNAT family N-acetyltransferase, partial [Flavisolibacter sp.]|nr:GNAT family N-acetyltransferase [Flavisolibacter sp.]
NRVIRYLRQSEINKEKWDLCISNSPNGSIYSYSFYLDHLADNWDALVLNDYEAVMPLPWRKKWTVYYIYQPFLTAQLGVIGKYISADLLNKFLSAIPTKFKYWDFPLNRENLYPVDFPLYQRINYVLNLKKSYDQLHSNYKENIRRNIKKSKQFGCYSKNNIDVDEIISIAKAQTKNYIDDDFENFKSLFYYLHQQQLAKTYGVFSQKDELIASAVFFFSHNRAYYILVGNHPNCRTLGASHALINSFIKDHSEQDLVLDFEGSDIRNLAYFYSSFGAVEESYAAIKLNKLPWWLKWLKKA